MCEQAAHPALWGSPALRLFLEASEGDFLLEVRFLCSPSQHFCRPAEASAEPENLSSPQQGQALLPGRPTAPGQAAGTVLASVHTPSTFTRAAHHQAQKRSTAHSLCAWQVSRGTHETGGSGAKKKLASTLQMFRDLGQSTAHLVSNRHQDEEDPEYLKVCLGMTGQHLL